MFEHLIDNVVEGIVFTIAIFFILGGTAATLIASTTQVSGSGLPLASLFSNTGVILTLFMLGIFMALVFAFMKFYKRKG